MLPPTHSKQSLKQLNPVSKSKYDVLYFCFLVDNVQTVASISHRLVRSNQHNGPLVPLAVHIIYSHPQIALTHGKGQKLANDQSVQGGIFAHTSLPISTPCSLPAAENLGLYIIFPQQQPPSLISVWKLWRSIGNGEKTFSCDSATHANNSNSPQAVSDTSLRSGDPAQDLPLDLGKETMRYTTHEAYGFLTHDCIIFI